MTRDELLEMYNNLPDKTQIPPELKAGIKNLYKFIDTMAGDKRFAVYLHAFLNDINEPPACIVCGSPVRGTTKIDFSVACSRKCAAIYGSESAVKTNLAKYGHTTPMKSEVVKDKIKQTMLSRYGVDNYSKAKDYADKVKQTSLAKFGVEHYAKTDEFSQRIRQTSNEKYGTNHYSQTESFRNSIKQTSLIRYGVENHSQAESYKRYALINKTSYNAYTVLTNKDALESHYQQFFTITEASKDLGVSGHCYGWRLKTHDIQTKPPTAMSIGHRELVDFFQSLNVKHIVNDRSHGFELDIFIPEHKLAVEFNGVYWHSELFQDKDKHQKKSLECMKLGIKLVHVWEDDWCDPVKRGIILNKLSYMVGAGERVYARKCSVIQLSNDAFVDFCSKHHIQGGLNSSLSYGLLYKGELVAVMGFKVVKGIHHLTRMASSMSVVGGASKLLSHFMKNNQWTEIETFASLDYSHGGVYHNLGFTQDGITPPNYWYVINKVRQSRQKFMKHKLKNKLKVYDETLTEHENMRLNGLYRVYDAGSISFSMKNPFN